VGVDDDQDDDGRDDITKNNPPTTPTLSLLSSTQSSDWIVSLAHSIDTETLRSWMTDQCASHVLRSLLAALSGRCYNNNTNNTVSTNHHNNIGDEGNNSKKKKNKKKNQKRKRQTVDEEYAILTVTTTTTSSSSSSLSAPASLPSGFSEARQRLQSIVWDHFDDNWPYHASACPLLCLLLVDHHHHTNDEQQPHWPQSVRIVEDWMYDATASRFWQAAVAAMTTTTTTTATNDNSSTVVLTATTTTIANEYRNKVAQYIQHDIANYCVQTMLETHGHWVDECLAELPYLMDIAHRRRGVLWKLARACRRRGNHNNSADHQHDQQQQQKQRADQLVRAIEAYGLRQFATEGPPSLAVLLELLPSMSSSHLWTPSLVGDLCRNSLASKVLMEPWIEQSQSRDHHHHDNDNNNNIPLPPILDQWADLARHPVGQHVVAKYVWTTRSVPDELLVELQRCQNHPIAKRLLHERLQLPLYVDQGAKAWRKALFGTDNSTGNKNNKKRKEKGTK
jgi:hypothetical protein